MKGTPPIIPEDADVIPPGMIRASDFLEMVDMFIEDLSRSITNGVNDANASPERINEIEAAIERGKVKTRAIIDQTLSPKH